MIKWRCGCAAMLGGLSLMGLAGCAGEPYTPQRVGGEFVYPMSDQQALAQCKAEALRDFHNNARSSIFDALDIGTPIRRCMAGKGYN